MEQNTISAKESPEHVPAEAEIETSSEEKGKREKVDCSHRVIEKRRRDRINNSLMQLSKLVPIDKFNKKNSGKLEKAEILEETVHYLTQQQFKKESEPVTETSIGANEENFQTKDDAKELTSFLRGFNQCVSDATKFFRDVEELDVSEGRCYRLIQYLKRQVSRYENEERVDLTDVVEGRLVWDAEESNDDSERSLTSESSNKRKNGGDLKATYFKKPRSSNKTDPGKSDQPSNSTESDRSSDNSPSTSASETASNSGSITSSSRNYMPFVFPNIPLFTTLPFAGANNMPFQTSPSQFPGYPYQQSPQYIPVALPQFPHMGMNFMSGFGVVNNDQSQSGSMANSVQNGLAVHSQMPGQPMPGLLPVGMPNGFFPSMYTNGFHANLMSMRPTDSGYESSEKSSSSKTSGSETSPQSFSDDSCQSYVT